MPGSCSAQAHKTGPPPSRGPVRQVLTAAAGSGGARGRAGRRPSALSTATRPGRLGRMLGLARCGPHTASVVTALRGAVSCAGFGHLLCFQVLFWGCTRLLGPVWKTVSVPSLLKMPPVTNCLACRTAGRMRGRTLPEPPSCARLVCARSLLGSECTALGRVSGGPQAASCRGTAPSAALVTLFGVPGRGFLTALAVTTGHLISVSCPPHCAASSREASTGPVGDRDPSATPARSERASGPAVVSGTQRAFSKH